MGAIFGLGFVVYLLLCGALVPASFLGRNAQERKCEAEHNVYDCERIETWVPVVPQKGGGE